MWVVFPLSDKNKVSHKQGYDVGIPLWFEWQGQGRATDHGIIKLRDEDGKCAMCIPFFSWAAGTRGMKSCLTVAAFNNSSE